MHSCIQIPSPDSGLNASTPTLIFCTQPTEDLTAQNFFFDPKHVAAGKKRKQRQQQQQLSGDGELQTQNLHT